MAGRVCAIIGVGPGLGQALAERFGAEGFELALIARKPAGLAAIEAELGRVGVKSKSFAADAADAASLRTAFAGIREQLGDPELLIYNASVMRQAMPSSLSADILNHDLAANVTGALVAAQAVLPAMKRNKRGTILITGGGLALKPWAEVASLAIGKAAIRSLALCLAEELEPQAIHVATVTIAGMIREGTAFDPKEIAKVYWELFSQPRDQWESERVLS